MRKPHGHRPGYLTLLSRGVVKAFMSFSCNELINSVRLPIITDFGEELIPSEPICGNVYRKSQSR